MYFFFHLKTLSYVCKLTVSHFFMSQKAKERIHTSQLPSSFQTKDHPFTCTVLQLNHSALPRRRDLHLQSYDWCLTTLPDLAGSS